MPTCSILKKPFSRAIAYLVIGLLITLTHICSLTMPSEHPDSCFQMQCLFLPYSNYFRVDLQDFCECDGVTVQIVELVHWWPKLAFRVAADICEQDCVGKAVLTPY